MSSTYRGVANVPDQPWARSVIDWALAEKIIITGDSFPDDWERDLMTDGRFWTFLYRILGSVTAATLPDLGIRHVTQDGDDAKDGLSWATAKATPQAAYDELITRSDAWSGDFRKHVGEIRIAGRTDGDFYDVGDGLLVDNFRTARFVGVGTRAGSATYQSAARLGTSSATATALIASRNAPDTSYGLKFEDLTFNVDQIANPALTAMIQGKAWNMVDVVGCQARPTSGTWDGYFIEALPGMDNSWWTVENNRTQSMGFLKVAGLKTNQNNNRWWVAHNQAFVSNPNLRGIIDTTYWFDATVIGNNLEGDMTGLYAEQCGNLTLGNSGESNSGDYPFYHFKGGWWNVITGGRCQIAGNDGVFLQQDGGLGTVIVNPQVRRSPNGDHAKNQIAGTSASEVTLLSAGGLR